MKFAIYRVLYAGDFLEESIASIVDHFDKIFIFWTDTPWGEPSNTQNTYSYEAIDCEFKGKQYTIRPVSDVLQAISNLENKYHEKVICSYNHVENNVNQITYLMNDVIAPKYGIPDILMFIEPDHVWPSGQLEASLRFIEECQSGVHFGSRQYEFWKTPEYLIPDRPGRLSCMFWRLDGLLRMPPTGRHGEDHKTLRMLDTRVYNLGFCASDETMWIKHLLAMRFSKLIEDSAPNEDWYHDKWKTWNYHTNNKNLEISKGYEWMIPNVVMTPFEVSAELMTKCEKVRNLDAR